MPDSHPADPRATAPYPAGPASTIDAPGDTTDPGTGGGPRPVADLPPGYDPLGPLGRGGMGVVYQARQRGLNRDVAVKMLLAGGDASAAELARFRAEAEAVARLQHPHVVQVFEVGEHRGRPFFSMEFCPGGSLAARLAGDPLPARDAARLVAKIARAVQAAHAAGIVHRDLKPGNVLLDAAGEPKVTDFGLAKQLGSAEGVTVTGAVMGTPSYMAPEQASGDSKRVGPAADVYALGAVLYECLTGRPPFKAADPYRAIHMVLTEDPVAPRSLDAAIPRDVETIALTCLRKDPRRRYATAAALAADLDRFLAGRPITARPVGPAERLWKSARRNKELAAAALVLAAAAAAAGWLAVRAAAAEGAAKEQLTRANAAEAEMQRRLADSYLQQARLQMQRGRWEDALASLDRAAAEGHPDPAAIRVAKVRVYFALNRTDRAREEIGTLETADGTADLFRADLLLGVDNAAALRHARAAIAGGLPPGERAYAAGLVAADAAGAEAGFRAAVEHEPYHSRANQLLGWVLIVQGRTDAALLHVARARAFFPDDPNLSGMELLALAAQGKRAEAEAAYRRTARGLAAEDRRLFWSVARLLLDMHDLEAVLTASELEMALTLGRVFSAAPPDAGPPPAARPLGRYAFPPFLETAFGPFGDLFATTSAADVLAVYQRFTQDPEAVARIAEALNESTVLFVRGAGLLGRNDFAGARTVLARAAAAPSLFKTRRVALTLLAVAEWQLGVHARGEERARWFREAAGRLRDVYANGGTPRFSTMHAIDAATDVGEFELARRMAADYEGWAPLDVGARLRRAHLERRAGNHAAALERYDRLRRERLSPHDAAAVARGAELSRAALRALAGKYAPPLEAAPPPRPAK